MHALNPKLLGIGNRCTIKHDFWPHICLDSSRILVYQYKGCAIKVGVKFNLNFFHLIKSFSNEIDIFVKIRLFNDKLIFIKGIGCSF